MKDIRTIGFVLIILGILAFSYQGYVTYTTRDQVLDAGPIHVTAEKTHKVLVPPTLGTVALVAGAVLLVASVKRP